MKADLRISIKDYRRNKSLKVLLFRTPGPAVFVRMNGDKTDKTEYRDAVESVLTVYSKWITN